MGRVNTFKPSNLKAKFDKPSLLKASEVKPNVRNTNNTFTDQLYDITLGAGMYMGIPVGHTYTENIEIKSTKSP